MIVTSLVTWQCSHTEKKRRYNSNPFAIPTLEGGEWSARSFSRFTPAKDPVLNFTGVWVNLRAGLNDWEDLATAEIRFPDLPAGSDSLSVRPFKQNSDCSYLCCICRQIVFVNSRVLHFRTQVRLEYVHIQAGARNVVPFYHPIKIVASQYRYCKHAGECCSSWKMR